MKFSLASTIATFALLFSSADAAYTIKDGKLIPTAELSSLSPQEHYRLMLEAEENAQWDDLVLQSNIINKNFPDTPFADEAQYFLAVGYFHLGELETANRQFSSYLKQPSAPKYFEEAIRFKFEIAQKFEQGSRTHILGLSALPKWMPAKEIAIDIYDEVITALPHHELTVQSLFGKACLQLALKEYSTSIETYQLIIRKFSKHPLASESYVGIAKVYLEQCQNEYPDPDFLDLAEINYKKYKSEFSLEPKLEVAHEMLSKMREIYAGTLYETAQFYERTKKPQASAIYYNKILAKYPKTDVAHMSDQRLVYLESKLNRPLRDAPLLEDHEGQVVISSEPEQEATELVDQKE